MNYEQMEYIRDHAENEGFDYCFTGYSDFLDIKDEEFHKLRVAYVKAAEELKGYLGIKSWALFA
jgi:hypothetical protein